MGSKSKCTGKGFSDKKAQKTQKLFLCLLCLFVVTVAQTPAPQSYVLRPARVFDGESAQLHDGWVVVVTRTIVATGSYAPKGYAAEWRVPQGAEEADGVDSLIRVVRDQIGKGADWIKVYADYGWGPNGEPEPTFSLDELKLIVETAKSSGRRVAAHASSAEGMRRAILAGVETIEHGNAGTPEVFRLMKEHNGALCRTLTTSKTIRRDVARKRPRFTSG